MLSELEANPQAMTAQATPYPAHAAKAAVRRYPCSPTQHRFWVLNQLEPGDSSLNVAVRWRIDGTLEPQTVQAAFVQIIQRHEVLRTYFTPIAGDPQQVVEPSVPFRVSVVDLTGRDEASATAAAEALASKEAKRPFQLATAPLLRVTQILLTPDSSVLLLTAHHIICDGWSIGLIAAELGELCDALQTDRPPQLPELEINYGDYAAWMLEWLSGDELSVEQDFWLPQLAGAHYFELATDRPRPAVWDNQSEIASRLLPIALTQRLSQTAASHGCTLYMLMMSALLTLLHRYSDETDISLGTQVAGRSEVETEALIGVFINTLVLRHDLAGDPTFDALLKAVRKTTSEAFDHEYMPIERLIELLKPKRDTSRNPLFSVNFIFQRSFVENRQYKNFALVDLPSRSAGALYDLNFFMVERPEGWRFSCEYNRRLFQPDTVEQLLNHLLNLLAQILLDTHKRLSEYPLMPVAERDALMRLGNQTEQSYPADQTLLDLFGAQVNAHPDKIAVRCGDESLSYAELDQQANQLAHKLVQLDWAPATRIGVFLNRSPQLLVSLLAVMKAGSAYVPLDPHYPAERIGQIVEDGQLAGILTNRALYSLLDSLGAPRWSIDSEPDLGYAQGSQLAAISPADSAYVIFTSGSTGRPKGVEIGHQALTNFLCAMRQQPGMTSADRLLAVTTVSFDIAALELYLPLISGAEVVIAKGEDVVDGGNLAALLQQAQITLLQATPITWRLLLDAGWRPDSRLKMLCGGEALPRPLADQLIQNGGQLWNMYGPTETTIWSSVLKVGKGDGTVPVGPPIANTQFQVLDRHGNLCPIGVPGELHIGGDGVAKGYLNRPELTAERFIPDPFSEQTNARIYRTGDRVRKLSDGSLLFLGRTDHQIKLRGYRIELGEIDAQLCAHPNVAEAVTILGESCSGEPALWSYLVAEDDQPEALLIREVRAALSAHLPSYMHPAAITLLAELPRTPNGKTDRRALPPPSRLAVQESREPLDDWESAVAELWREVLDWEGPLHHDSNFFELGGHSISAARLLAKIEQETGRHITLAQLFHSPTLEALAELMRPRSEYEDDFRQIVRLQAHGSQPPIFALHNTGTYFSVSKQLGADYPFISLQLFDPDYPTDNLPETLEEVAKGYVALIKQVKPQGPYYLLGWCLMGILSFEVARQLRLGGDQASLVILDGWAPGHTAKMPKLKRAFISNYYRLLVFNSVLTQVRRGDLKIKHWIDKRLTIRQNKSRQRAMLQQAYHQEPSCIPTSERRDRLESYGQWLFAYLEKLIDQYEIQPYPDDILVLRSEYEPRSRLLDWDMGWASYSRSVTVKEIHGDHWTMLQGVGAEEISTELRTLLAQERA